MDIDYQKVGIDVEFSHGDEFMNYNVLTAGKNGEVKSPNGGNQGVTFAEKSPSQEQDSQNADEPTENIGKGAAILLGKAKNKLKPKAIETEYLRTDFKLANIPSPINMK